MIKAFGFMQTYGEACVYKKVSGSSVAFLILYVDDILLMRNDIELLESIKAYLNKCFLMKDLGEAAYILGIKIYRDRSRRLIGLSQSTYLLGNVAEIQNFPTYHQDLSMERPATSRRRRVCIYIPL